MNIEVVRDESPLRRQRWEFSVATELWGHQITVAIDRYAVETRESTRKRKWIAEREYVRHNRRRLELSSTWLAEPPLPDDVREEVLRRMVEGTVFKMPKAGDR